jgi:transposase InsO family protein
MGEQKTLERVKAKYIWHGYSRDVVAYVKSCRICSCSKKASIRPRAALGEFHDGFPMERVHMDILGPFITSALGNRYVLMIIDQFTKWVECYALPEQGAELVAKTYVERFVTTFGCSYFLHTDQGRNFESNLFKELCHLLEISKTRTTAYRPCSNGQIERINRTVLQCIRCYLQEHDRQKDWDKCIPFIAGAIRSTVSRQTGYTPNMMMLGREVLQPIDIMCKCPVSATTENAPSDASDFVQQLQQTLYETHEIARDNLKMAQKRQKK